MLRPQSGSQQITGQDQLYQKLKEHLYYLIQWHGEHESAKTKLLQHFGHFRRAIHTIVAIFDPTWVFSNGVVTFNIAIMVVSVVVSIITALRSKWNMVQPTASDP